MKTILLCLFLLPMTGFAQGDLPPKGVVIYKTNPTSGDQFAKVVEYSELEVFPAALKGIMADGSKLNLAGSNVVALFEYPDLEGGSISSEREVADFKELGKKLMEAVEKYPAAKGALAPHLEKMKEAARKFNQGMYLSGGKWLQKMEAPPLGGGGLGSQNGKEQARQDKKEGVGVVVTREGRKFINYKIVKMDRNQVTIMDERGVSTVPWTLFDKSEQLTLGYDAEKIAEQVHQEIRVKKDLLDSRLKRYADQFADFPDRITKNQDLQFQSVTQICEYLIYHMALEPIPKSDSEAKKWIEDRFGKPDDARMVTLFNARLYELHKNFERNLANISGGPVKKIMTFRIKASLKQLA